jgi:sigma-B regulation protein RsbU (phosphoserine phosphatase)
LRFLNAGHNPAFVIRSEGSTKLGASSFPLGMLASADYGEGLVEFQSGDILLAYSDGLTEAMNEHGEEFGMARLESLLPGLRGLAPEQAGSRLLEAVDAFLGGVRASDDLSLAIVVRR